MKSPTEGDVVAQAGKFLEILNESAGPGLLRVADDMLLFCYRLRDEHKITRSTSARFRGRAFGFLNDVLYRLESDPDQTLQSEEWCGLLKDLFRDLAEGKILVAKKQ